MPATGADIPPELLPRILDYVGTNDRGYGWYRYDDRNKGEGLRDLKSCSLVCVDWANRCRPALFDRAITMRSQKDMESLNFCAKHGSKRITPIDHQIYRWGLEQTWTSQSWCHLRYTSSFHLENDDTDGIDLKLVGPVPSSLPVSALHSPHWSLPRSMPACYTPFVDLTLTDIHFPSLSSLFKLARHFKLVEWLKLEKITWDQVEVMAPAMHNSRIINLQVDARGCTNNVDAPVALAALCPGSAFSRLHPKERNACLMWVQKLAVPPSAAVDHTDIAAGSLLGARSNPDTSFVSKKCRISSKYYTYRPGMMLTVCCLCCDVVSLVGISVSDQ